MSKNISSVLVICAVAFVAGCAKKQEEFVVVSEPVSMEPVYTGKYK